MPTDQVRSEKSLPTLAAELWDMVRAYAKQETVQPVKGLGRYVAFGAAGSALLGLGLVLLSLGLLRLLQSEATDTFDGNWSWAPYLITLVAACVPIALAARAMGRRSRP